MKQVSERFELRIGVAEKRKITEAARKRGMSVAAFVRIAALQEATRVPDDSSALLLGGITERMRGKATAGFTTEEILALTRAQ
ncbi:DUF1778 domain-containing protein [Algiphilus sp.]|uniref:plasmid mobilization protein n=1 Tax=Algiphilus sp. TaxID=1872431 RepID=UPI0032EF08C4